MPTRAFQLSRIKYRCRLVLYVNGERVVTDVKINDGNWHFLCVSWEGERGSWRVSVDGILGDSGAGLAQGTAVRGNNERNHQELFAQSKL